MLYVAGQISLFIMRMIIITIKVLLCLTNNKNLFSKYVSILYVHIYVDIFWLFFLRYIYITFKGRLSQTVHLIISQTEPDWGRLTILLPEKGQMTD